MDTRSEPECAACREFRDHVFHFQAEEIPAAQRARLEEHLHACPACAGYLEVETGFATVLRAGLARAQAPDSLHERICKSIECERPLARRATAGRRVLVIAALAAAVAFAVALVAPPLFRGVSGRDEIESGRHVVRSVVVVDEECDRAGRSTDQQRHCSARSHYNALRIADGTYWVLSLDVPEARQLASDVEMRGRRIVVEGDLYAPMRTLHLARWRELRGGAL